MIEKENKSIYARHSITLFLNEFHMCFSLYKIFWYILANSGLKYIALGKKGKFDYEINFLMEFQTIPNNSCIICLELITLGDCLST